MMEDNKTFFNYISQVFATFGMIVLIFIILGIVVGEQIRMYSSLFEYGKGGLSMSTLVQLFVFAIIISAGQVLFLTDKWIKNMPIIWRNVCFFSVVIIVLTSFCIKFQWFPITDRKAWIGFIVSFLVCSAIGIIISRIKEKAENKKMAQILDKWKKDI